MEPKDTQTDLSVDDFVSGEMELRKQNAIDAFERQQNDEGDFRVDGVYSISNAIGFEVQISGDGEYARFRRTLHDGVKELTEWKTLTAECLGDKWSPVYNNVFGFSVYQEDIQKVDHNQCPKCGSKNWKRHPATQFEGEVSICSHPFHVVANEWNLFSVIPVGTKFKRSGRFGKHQTGIITFTKIDVNMASALGTLKAPILIIPQNEEVYIVKE